jgi:hypothetical protein
MQIIAQSNNPAYKPLALAAPCFIGKYHDVMLNLRDNGVDNPDFQNIPYYIQFNESGNIRAPYIVDSEADFTAGNLTAYSFDFDAPVSRDYRIEDDAAAVRGVLDWMAAHAAADRHFWYNTLAHGGNNESVANVLNYAHQNYGRAGDNSGWIAPADRIYSYLLTKDAVQVTFLGHEPGEPTLEQTYLPTIMAGLSPYHFVSVADGLRDCDFFEGDGIQTAVIVPCIQ